MMRFFLVLLVLPFVSLAQDFQLKEVNVEQIRSTLQSADRELDPIYVYLQGSYPPTSEKVKVEKYEYPDYSICSFEQEFGGEILYSTESCREEGGVTTRIVFPLMDKANLTEWIEKIDSTYPSQTGNFWNTTKTVYGPGEEEAGCHYQIKETEKNIVVENYCGC